MSVHEYMSDQKGILAGFLAAEPKSKIIGAALAEMQAWRVNRFSEDGNAALTCLSRGLRTTMEADCPLVDLEAQRDDAMSGKASLQWNCSQHVLRFYAQKRLRCRVPDYDVDECPMQRLFAEFEGLKMGIFQPGRERQLLAYPCPLEVSANDLEDKNQQACQCWQKSHFGETLSFAAQNSSDRRQIGEPRIPRQLIMTGHKGTFNDLPIWVTQKVRRTLENEPGMILRWFNDMACHRYIKSHFDPTVAKMLDRQEHGSFRGDICRTAILLREGGYYMDLDVELRVPLHTLVNEDTSFMAAYEFELDQEVGILNALMAVEPQSPVMRNALDIMRYWFNEEIVLAVGKMGPMSLGAALRKVLAEECPKESLDARREEVKLPGAPLQWGCANHAFRFYVQGQLNCSNYLHPDPAECSQTRLNSTYGGLKFGLFMPGAKRSLIGFPRSEDCDEPGCRLGGNDQSGFLLSPIHLKKQAEVPKKVQWKKGFWHSKRLTH